MDRINAAKILTCNLDMKQEAAVRALCGGLAVQSRPVSKEEQGERVGTLAGILPPSDSTGFTVPFFEPMLVLCGFSEWQMNAFLEGLRHAGVSIPLKAVMTPANSGWPLARLYQELEREHQAVRKRTERKGQK